MAQPQTPAFMTVAEVASMMRVSKMTVYRLVHSGELPQCVWDVLPVPVAAVQEFMASGLGDWSHGDAAAFGS